MLKTSDTRRRHKENKTEVRDVDPGRLRLPGGPPGKKKEADAPFTKTHMQVRVVALAVIVAVFFVVLAGRLWHLQVLTGAEYDLSAQETHTRTIKIPAQRGVIYDREGRAFANNGPGLNVTIVPSKLERDKVEELAEVLGADAETVMERYDAVKSSDPYSPMLVKENADREAVTYVSERTEEYAGLVVNDDYIRNYPRGEVAAHVLGFTGPVTEEELGMEGFEGVGNDAIVGKGGVELAYEEVLRGKPGENKYDVDALGRQVAVRRADGSRYDGLPEGIAEQGRPARVEQPVPGKDLRLTIDLDLQEVAEDELDAAMYRAKAEGYSGTGGAIVAMDPRNGEILALASRPAFEPQLFVGGITGAEEIEQFDYLNSEGANFPFTSRATSGSYPGASAMKAFTGLAGLDTGAVTPRTVVRDRGRCWRPRGNSNRGDCWLSWRQTYKTGTTHGIQNLAEALMDSNDKYFYQVADWIWNRTDDENLLSKFYKRFGFGAQTGIDLPAESPGLVPDRQWQESFGTTPEDQQWGVGRWVNMSIGQGDFSVTPLQLVRGYAAIQNGGTLVTPHVGLEITDQYGEKAGDIPLEPKRSVNVDQRDLDATVEGLRLVTGPDGTAAAAFAHSELRIVGKSGTGEMKPKDPVNWFVGWAEDQGERPMVVVAMVEGGGHSEETVAPATRHVLEAYHGIEYSQIDAFPAVGLEDRALTDEELAKTAAATADTPAGYGVPSSYGAAAESLEGEALYSR